VALLENPGNLCSGPRIVALGGWRYRAYWLNGAGRGWLLLAGVAFVVSIALDLHFDTAAQVPEESAKWLGICALFLYVFQLTASPPPSEKIV